MLLDCLPIMQFHKHILYVCNVFAVPLCFYRSHLSFYGVFDGHGGRKASKYAAEHLHKIIAQKFPKGNVTVTSSQLPVT
jgi:hypothetical protein